MAYAPHRHSVQEIRVDARIDSQQILTVFHLMNANSGAPALETGSSQVLLESFRLNFQNHLLPRLSNAYTVAQYTISEIRDAVAGPPRPITVAIVRYMAAKKDIITGAVADTGGAVIVNRLPSHEVVRVFKKPATLARGFFSGNYHRISGFGEPDHSDTQPEQWAPTLIDPLNVAWESFRIAPLLDGSAAPDNAWTLCVWSPMFMAKTIATPPVDPPPPPTARLGARQITQYSCDVYVGTQISRRFTPKGFISGK